jgi:drug/metabolite transporter (DMT)-like permease
MQVCTTVAFQNERTGFISMVGYIGLVYAFGVDIFFYKQTFSTGEIVGVSIVLTFLMILMLYNVYFKAK